MCIARPIYMLACLSRCHEALISRYHVIWPGYMWLVYLWILCKILLMHKSFCEFSSYYILWASCVQVNVYCKEWWNMPPISFEKTISMGFPYYYYIGQTVAILIMPREWGKLQQNHTLTVKTIKLLRSQKKIKHYC